jgi:basic membrane protein A
VAALGESDPASPSGLAWTGAQEAASTLHATATLVTPKTLAELTAAPASAAAAGSAIVVTVGAGGAPADLAAARAYPTTQFFEVDQTVPAGAPANLHGLVFDEAEAGYLAGVIAANVSAKGSIGIVGDSAADTRSANYLAGFRAGALFAKPSVKVAVAYAGVSNAPDKGRTAAAGLIKKGADVVLALPDLSGIGAMRQACSSKAQVIAADTDAWLLVPDVRPCLVTSIRKRFDVAARDAILHTATGQPVPALTMADVASGGIDVTDFHTAVPSQLETEMLSVMAAMQGQPPRSTPAPSPTH